MNVIGDLSEQEFGDAFGSMGEGANAQENYAQDGSDTPTVDTVVRPNERHGKRTPTAASFAASQVASQETPQEVGFEDAVEPAAAGKESLSSKIALSLGALRQSFRITIPTTEQEGSSKKGSFLSRLSYNFGRSEGSSKAPPIISGLLKTHADLSEAGTTNMSRTSATSDYMESIRQRCIEESPLSATPIGTARTPTASSGRSIFSGASRPKHTPSTPTASSHSAATTPHSSQVKKNRHGSYAPQGPHHHTGSAAGHGQKGATVEASSPSIVRRMLGFLLGSSSNNKVSASG